MGADDYVPKPFDPRELLARVKSVLRRTSPAARADLGAERVRIGRCVLDLAAHRLTDETGKEVPMSPLEFDLLKALAEHPEPAAFARAHPEPRASSATGIRSTAASICASCGCARRSSPIPSIRSSSGRCATKATSSCPDGA